MKLLLYGGCHALILKRLIEEIGPIGRHEIDLLINFELIGRGQPFPYETLRQYDAVIYSPVENKQSYNTCNLDAACADMNVTAIRFPWLEWHGYATGAAKNTFWGHHSWFFPGLIELAHGHSELSTFTREAREAFPSDEAIRQCFSYSISRLADQESRHRCEVIVSDFIMDRYRDQRLFLVPDHPSLIVYKHVLQQIERLLGERLIETWSDDIPEPQPEETTPILPRVAHVTDLAPKLHDETWRCSSQPIRSMTLDDFLTMHFLSAQGKKHDQAWDAASERGFILATAVRNSWIISEDLLPDSSHPVEAAIFDQLIMRRDGPPDPRGLFAGNVLASFGSTSSLRGRQLFRTGDWICRS